MATLSAGAPMTGRMTALSNLSYMIKLSTLKLVTKCEAASRTISFNNLISYLNRTAVITNLKEINISNIN